MFVKNEKCVNVNEKKILKKRQESTIPIENYAA